MDNLDKLATQGTQDEEKKPKATEHHVYAEIVTDITTPMSELKDT